MFLEGNIDLYKMTKILILICVELQCLIINILSGQWINDSKNMGVNCMCVGCQDTIFLLPNWFELIQDVSHSTL